METPVRLRGAFNPRVQVIIGLATIGAYASLLFTVWGVDWARLDIRLAPVVLLVGILFGLPIGSLRLRALRKVLPHVDGHLYLSASAVLSQVREGENAQTLQRTSWAVAFLIWFALATQSKSFYASLGSFILGSYLTGQVLPFIRLWIELRKTQGKAT